MLFRQLKSSAYRPVNFARMIEQAGLAATPGFCFGSDKHIRLTYCYGGEQLEEGMNRLESFVNSLNNGDNYD